jgi:hypothetical protein
MLHYAIATVTSATTFNQKIVAKVLLLPFLGLLLQISGIAFDRKPCSGIGLKLRKH